MTRATASIIAMRSSVSGGGGQDRRRREISPGKPRRAPLGRAFHPADDFPDLLVLQQPPHQLGPGILPAIVVHPAGEQHLGLEPQQAAGHVQIVSRLIQAQVVDGPEELVGNPRDGNIRDVDPLFPKEVQEQIERPGEGIQFDDEPRLAAGDGHGCVHSRHRQGHPDRRGPWATMRPGLNTGKTWDQAPFKCSAVWEVRGSLTHRAPPLHPGESPRGA